MSDPTTLVDSKQQIDTSVTEAGMPTPRIMQETECINSGNFSSNLRSKPDCSNTYMLQEHAGEGENGNAVGGNIRTLPRLSAS